MFRATLNNDTKLYRTFYSGSQPTDIDASGVPTVAVERADGTALAAPTATDEVTPGEYSITLTAATYTDAIDRLKVTWSGTVDGLAMEEVQYVDVVGSRYFTLGQLRSMEGLSSTQKYSDLYLARVRDEVEVAFEAYCEQSFVRKHARDVYDSIEFNGTYGIFTRSTPVSELLSVVLDGVAETLADNWSVSESGQVRADSFDPTANSLGQDLVISYVQGWEQPPADLQRIALRYARQLAVINVSTVPDRARLMQSEFGLFVLDAPGPDKATGIPEVDEVLNRYRAENVGSFA